MTYTPDSAPATVMRREKTAAHGLCTFSFEGRWFALDVDLVIEVVSPEMILSVPRSPPFVLGLFSLRGSPTAVVDLGVVLGFGPTASAQKAKNTVVVVIEKDDLVAAFPVDHVGEVVHPGRGVITPADADEHPAVSCFFSTKEAPVRVFTVLDAQHLLERMRARLPDKSGVTR
jgi:purine-binding chemotaxis protein CheW